MDNWVAVPAIVRIDPVLVSEFQTSAQHNSWVSTSNTHTQKQVYIEKKVSLWLLYGVQHSVIMADFIKHETQQAIIVIILIIYSPYILKDLVEL